MVHSCHWLLPVPLASVAPEYWVLVDQFDFAEQLDLVVLVDLLVVHLDSLDAARSDCDLLVCLADRVDAVGC